MKPNLKNRVAARGRGLLSVVLFLLAATPSKGQEQRIVFPEKAMTISAAFSEIEKQTDFLISTSYSGLDQSRKVKFTHNNLSLQNALSQLLKRSTLTYLIRGNHVLIVPSSQTETGILPTLPTEPAKEPVEEEQGEELPEIDLTRPPVDLDSLERALLSRKIDYPVEIPNEPALHTSLYYRSRDQQKPITGLPDYAEGLPKVAVRINLLYGLATLTPNLGFEIGLTPRSTLLLTGSYNPWKPKEDPSDFDNKKLCHWTVSAEYRYWFCERFNGHFMGVHAYYGYYNIAGKKVPLILEDDSDQYRYKGNVVGAGISYGYQWMLSRKWNLEVNAGVGFGYMKYDKADCPRCSTIVEKDKTRTFVAPTKLGISFVYIIK